jgi:hypothetical protein
LHASSHRPSSSRVEVETDPFFPAAPKDSCTLAESTLKKWLSYREREILGRDLQREAREVMNMARRIAAILLLQPQLDANYRRTKDAASDWSSVAAV